MEMLINNPINICGKKLNNRVVFQPMEGCDGTAEGGIGELTRRRYMRFAESGAAIIWFEAVSVSSECRSNPRQLYLNEKTKSSFAELIKDIKAHAFETTGIEPVIIMQMTHSGRWSKPNGYPEPLIAYHNELWEKGKENQPYKIVSDEYCDEIIKKYKISARLATEVGFDGIDVKCCHGYFLNEFLSAYQREGKYGGSFENRTRLFFNCLDAVKQNLDKNMFVTTRLNASDCFDYPYGFGVNEKNELDLTETIEIIKQLKNKGIELINLSLGNPYLVPHINRPCINATESGEVSEERIYHLTKELQTLFPDISFVISGLSYFGAEAINYAERILNEGVARLAGFGRMTIAYPLFYKDLLDYGKIDKNKCCISCGKCTELMRHGSVAGCPIRDGKIYMPYYKKYVKGEK